MGRIWHRARALAPAIGCLLVALLLAATATGRSELACERATGTCRWSTGGVGTRTARAFPIADVREVRFVDGLGKHGRDAETALIFATGAELRLGHARRDHARARFEAAHAFFARGATLPRLAFASASPRWLWAAAAALLAAAGGLAGRGWHRSRASAPIPATPKADPARRRRVIIVGAGLAVVVVGVQLVMRVVAAKTQGTLELRCETRCKLDGIECLRGAESSMTLDPGTYTIEVWTGAAEAPWAPRTFEIVVGETTTYVCAP